MPSPIGHSLGVLALLWFVPGLRTAERRRPFWITVGWLFVAANAPDLDFIPGILMGQHSRFHYGPTHSLVAVVFVWLLTWGLARALGLSWARQLALWTAAAYGSHLVFDMMTWDGVESFGVLLLWPLSAERVSLPLHVFMDIRRNRYEPNFALSLMLAHNVAAVVREGLFVAMALLGWWLVRRIQSRGSARPPV